MSSNLETMHMDAESDPEEKAAAESSLITERGFQEYQTTLGFQESDIKGKRVLDLGSGPRARFAAEAKEKYPDATMVSLDYSFSEPMKKDPRNRLQDEKRRKGEKDPNRVIGFATSLPFADESFDTIVASVSIPFYLLHDEEIEKAFSEIARVLRPQGKGYFHPINHIKEIKEYHPDGHYGGTPHEKYTSEEVQPVLEAILDKLKDKITYEFHRALYQDRFHDLKLIKDISLEITKI